MKQIFLLITFFLTLICNAQLKEKFEKGWFINNDNFKMEGYIRSDDLSKFSTGICFKRNLDLKECQAYNITQIKSFRIGNGNTFNLLHFKINKKQQEIELFVNLIIKGNELSLYRGIYKSEPFYVLSKNDKNYVLQKDKLISGETKFRKYNYKGILNFVTEGLAQRDNKKIKFDEDYFVRIVIEYNSLKNATVNDLRIKEKAKNYLLTNIGVGVENDGFQYYGQIIHRKFYPKISRSTSLNVGLNYFNYEFKVRNRNFTQSLLSIPLQIQNNILNKNIRPYIFAGLSFNYLRISDENNNSILSGGFQKSYGINLLYGAGIEIDILKNIYLKGEYRIEAYSHPIMFGIGYVYNFKNK